MSAVQQKFNEMQNGQIKEINSKQVKIAIICAGQMFGENDVVKGRPYTAQVTCVSTQAILYAIKAQEFVHKFSRDDRTWTMV